MQMVMAGEYLGQWNSSWIDGDYNLVSCFAGERGMETAHTSDDE